MWKIWFSHTGSCAIRGRWLFIYHGLGVIYHGLGAGNVESFRRALRRNSTRGNIFDREYAVKKQLRTTFSYHVYVFLREIELQCAVAALCKLRLCTGRVYVLRIYTAALRDSVPFVIFVWPGFSWVCYRSIYFRFAACVRNNIYDSFLIRMDQCHSLKNIKILTR